MTEERQDISEDFYAGNSKDLRVTIKDDNEIVVDLTGAELTYALFTDEHKVIFRKSSIIGPSEIDVPTPANGVCIVHILANDTILLKDIYRHQLSMVDASGNSSTVMVGKVHIFASFANRHRMTTTPAYLQGA